MLVFFLRIQIEIGQYSPSCLNITCLGDHGLDALLILSAMVYLSPPQLASSSRASYAEAYANILKAHRRSPLTSASSVIVLVAPDVDALCAARMLADLFRQDDVIYRIIPVSGIDDLSRIRDEMLSYSEVRIFFSLHPISSLAVTLSYSPQYGRNPRSTILRMVWRFQHKNHSPHHRFFAPSEPI